MRVKICGITNLTDALVACEAGADALGFVFYEKSPRFIDPKTAREIIRSLPPFVQKVGLFVNKTASEIEQIFNISRVDLAQIHFDADSSFYDELNVNYLPVVRAKSREKLAVFDKQYRLVDAFVEGYGGEGKRIDLSWFDGVDTSKIILAGGLNIENISEIKNYGFYGVDVSSGVELEKGKKDKTKVIEFIKKAKNL